MREPSVKGTLFQNLTSEILALRGSGRVPDEVLHRHLEPEEISDLDREVSIGAWYPLDTYSRMLALVAEVEPGPPQVVATRSGVASADRVIALGIYAQLDERTEEIWENRVGRILSTLWGSFFSFGQARWKDMQDRDFEIEMTGVGCMSDLMVLRTQGFIERLGQRASGDDRVVVRAERSAGGDTVFFRGVRHG